MSTSQTQVNTMLQAEISMANASQALAQSQWAEATVAYRLACNAFAALRATALDDKIKQQHLWGHCQSLIGLAYALHQQDALTHQAEVEALFLSVKAYQQSRPFIQHCFRQEDEPWLGYYQTLQEALHIPDAPSVLPVDMLQELDAERAFEALMASLEIQCQHDNQQQTPFYLVITYELRHIFRAYCESAYHVINMTHQDVHGRTLLAHAAFHQRGYMQRMLEEKAARQEKQADDYQAFVARQYEWQKTPVAMSPIYQEEDAWLSNTLRQLMRSDAYEAAAEALRQAWSFTRRLLSHHGAYQGKMDALVQALLPPERLVDGPSAEARFASVWAPIMREASPGWRSITSLSAQTDTKRLGELINTLKQLIKTLPKGVAYQPLSQALKRLQDCYQAFEDAVRADARAIFYSQDEGPCYIPIENLGCFLSEYDNNEEVTKVSNGQVHAVHGARGMHIKEDPEAHGVEYQTHALGNLLTGESSPPTRLVKLFHQNDDLLYMVSKTVEGESLEYICDTSPAYLKKIDPANFSRLVVLSIATNPHDGKGANYQVRPEYHVNGQGGAVMSTSTSSGAGVAQSPIVSGLPLAPVDSLKRIKITGIDNDDNFAREVTVGNDGRHAIGIHCILYSLSAMKQPVDVGVKQQLLYRKPAVLVLRWLHLLQIQNQHYATLNARGVLSDTQYRAAHIKLYPGTAREIYHKLVHIQTLLGEDRDNTLTHADLLRHVQPLVRLVYKRLAKGWLSPEGARKPLTPTQVYEALCDASKRGAWSIETLLADILDKELVPGEGVTIKEYLSTQTARESDYFNERKQSLEDAITDFVAHLSLDALPPDEATMVVSQLAESPLPIRALVLRRSSLTTDEIEHLLLESLGNKDNKGRFGAQGLQTLDLIDCNAVFADGDRMIARGEAYGVRVRLLRLVDERIPSPSSAPIDIENTLTTLTDSPSAFNLFFKSPPNSPLLLPSLLQRKLPMPIRYHWYKDHDIDDYLGRAITLAPLGGHGQHEYRVYGAGGAETIRDNRDKLPYHTFLLRAVGVVDAEPSTQPSSSSQASAEIAGGHDAQSTSPTLSLLMQTMDKWTKEPTQLMSVVQTAMQGDSRDDFISVLHEVTTLDTPYDSLHDLVAEHPTWDSLKPALIAFIDEQRGIDLADELFPCLAAPNAQAKILFALNESQAHWFVGELLLSKTTTETATETKVTYRLAAYAHDPYGGGQMPESMANAMHAALLRRLHMQDSSITHIELTRPVSPYRRRQAEGDGNSCGVVVAHDMVKRLKGQTLTISRPYPYGARTLRNQQSTLVGRELGAPEPASSPLPKPDVTATAAVDGLDDGQASSAPPPVSPLSQIKPEVPQAEQVSPPTRGSQRGAIRAPVGRPARERTKSTLTPRFDRRLEDGDPAALCYEVPYDAYEMVLDAIRASTADGAHHYLPFIQLLTCQDYALRADASAEEEIARRQRINQLVEGIIITTSQSGRRRLLGVPLHCRQHFSVDDITRFYDIAGSVSPMASADDWQRNLAIWAVIFSAPYIGCEQATMGEHVEPTQAIATYFREHFDALWTLPYPGAYSAEALYAVLHPRDDGRHKSRASLMVELDNAALKGFYSYIASCWRENHYYIEHWDVKHTRLTQINAKHWVVYRLAYPVWMIEKAIRGILEEKVFLSRRLDSLRLFAVLLGLLTSPTPDAYLSHLDTPGYQPGFLNGGLFRRIMTGYQLPEGSPIREVITSGALQAPLRQTVLDEEERAKLENEARALREQVEEEARMRRESDEKAKEEVRKREESDERARQDRERTAQVEARAKISEEIDEAASVLFQIAKESADSQKKMSPMINDAKQMYNNVLHLRDQIASLGGDLSQLEDVMQSCFSAEQHCQTVIERCKAAERRTEDLCAQKEIMRTQFRTAKAAEQEKSLEVLIDSLPAYGALGQTLLIAIAETAQAYKEQLNGYLEVTEIYREAMKVYQEAESSFQALKEEARAAQAQRQREADEAARREHERAEEERARADEEAQKRRESDEKAEEEARRRRESDEKAKEEARKRQESEDDARRARERAENAEKRLAAIEAEAEAKKARKAAKKAAKAQKQAAEEVVAPKVGTSTEPESSGHSRAHHQVAPSQPGTSEAGFFASSPQRSISAIPSAAPPHAAGNNDA